MVTLQSIIQNEYIIIIMKAILTLALGMTLNFFIRLHFKKSINSTKKTKSTEGKKMKRTRLEFLQILLTNLIFILTAIFILMLIPGFKTFSISLLAGAGIVAVVIGFAAQKTIANIVSGIAIAIYTPFRIGDRVKIGDEVGDIEDLSLRHTTIKTWDNRRIIIPNSVISEQQIINYSIKEEKILWTINMGISYDSDIDLAKKIMLQKAKEHPDVYVPEIKDESGILEKQEPKVKVTECGDFAVNLRIYFWVEKPNKAWFTGFDLTEEIKKEFDKEGIEIPFPYRTLVYKKDLEKVKKPKTKKK